MKKRDLEAFLHKNNVLPNEKTSRWDFYKGNLSFHVVTNTKCEIKKNGKILFKIDDKSFSYVKKYIIDFFDLPDFEKFYDKEQIGV